MTLGCLPIRISSLSPGIICRKVLNTKCPHLCLLKHGTTIITLEITRWEVYMSHWAVNDSLGSSANLPSCKMPLVIISCTLQSTCTVHPTGHVRWGDQNGICKERNWLDVLYAQFFSRAKSKHVVSQAMATTQGCGAIITHENKRWTYRRWVEIWWESKSNSSHLTLAL